MATTALWPKKGGLEDLIAYALDPEKTIPDLTDDRAPKDMKMLRLYREAAEKGGYVSALNCLKETASEQMLMTKKRFGKLGGYTAFHGYQSFPQGEVTPEICHEIGVKTAKEMWGGRFQVLVSTHLNENNPHNHFVFNSVSFRDGGKYVNSRKEMNRLRETSDRLCREYGLSVIEDPGGRAPPRHIWLAETAGKPTLYNVMREDVRHAIMDSTAPRFMEGYLRKLGYETDLTGEKWKISMPGDGRFINLETLDRNWKAEEIIRTMGDEEHITNRRAVVTYPPEMPDRLRRWFRPYEKTGEIYMQFLHYCYLLGILPEDTDYRPTSPILKTDLVRPEIFVEQVRYMEKYGIKTTEDLLADRKYIENEIEELKSRRRKLQIRIDRAVPERKEELKPERNGLTSLIRELRKRLRLNMKIERQSGHIQEKTDLYCANEERNREEQKRNRQERDSITR